MAKAINNSRKRFKNVTGTFYIRSGATGANNGSDWNNAFTSIPATPQRGALYYIAAGSYGSYVANTPSNNHQCISIVRASVADHGTGTGWSASYDNTVTLSSLSVYTDDWFFDGRGYDPNWYLGSTSGFGLQVIIPPGGGSTGIRLDNGALGGAVTGVSNVTFKNVAVIGKGRDNSEGGDILVYGLADSKYVTFRHCGFSDNMSAQFLLRGTWDNLTLDHCVGTRNTSTAAIHGEFMSAVSLTNLQISNCVFQDIEGSGIVAIVNNGSGIDQADIRGNIIRHTENYRNHVGRIVRTANFTGVISGNTLTVSGKTGDAIYVGMALTGTGVASNTVIDSFIGGTGGNGTYHVSISQTVSSRAMVANDPLSFGIAGVVNLAIATGGTGNNIRYYHNTHINVEGVWCGVHIESSGNIGNEVRNNIWWYDTDNGYPIPGYGGRTGVTGVNINDNNVFYHVWNENQPMPEFKSSFRDVYNGDLHLVKNQTGYITPLNVNPDIDGVTRLTYTLGAYEYV